MLAPAEVIRAALELLVRRRSALLRALIVPAACLVALDAVERHVSALGWAASGAHAVALWTVYSIFAVSCHRILLLENPALPNRWGIYLTAREVRFFGWSVLIAVMTVSTIVAVALPTWLLGLLLPGSLHDGALLSNLMLVVVGAPAWYVLSRASLVLPATALDRRPTMPRSWRLSEGNGWRLAVATGAPVLAVGILAWLLEATLGDRLGVVAGASLELGFALLGAFEVGVLSVSFGVLEARSSRATA